MPITMEIAADSRLLLRKSSDIGRYFRGARVDDEKNDCLGRAVLSCLAGFQIATVRVRSFSFPTMVIS